MKTIQYLLLLGSALMIAACGNQSRDLVATRWKTTNAGVSTYFSGPAAENYFKREYGTTNNTWSDKYIEFQTELIQTLGKRVFELNKDGSFTMTNGESTVSGTWELNEGTGYELIEFTAGGKLFETWRAEVLGLKTNGFKTLIGKNQYYDTHLLVKANYHNEAYKEIMGGADFTVQLFISPENPERFEIK